MMVSIVAAIYGIIAIAVTIGVYRKSPRNWQAAVISGSVGLLWPLMILVMLTSEERGI